MAVKNTQFTKIEIQIAKYLFKHYKDRYNARQLSRILNINHAHANKLCNILAGKKLLVKEKIGNSVFFSYEYYNKLAIKFMEYTLSLEEKEFPKWLSVLLHNLKKFKDYIEMGLVFGSSINTKDFNDVDVLLMYNIEKSKDIKRIKNEIRKSELVEKPIRYIEITESDAVLNRGDKIFYNILSDNLIFHNPEKYVEVIKKCHK
ncbi:TPA: hypothetical protein HA235_04940 [Candidatus Woesearchaeota archaeon]|nr:hypothetical protein [Candidatus Woesearchaeota archaeon]HIH32027.1 hypothetical protein [Candidatus Woesearchaeota archaeon]HIH55234.1 hypothetical protein [Candidatus Woesearchaeota archaeon]HIJ01981.1 hypothetical protein [Candidatus Woesearchaeota archaeon]HIJ14518.1 hypothetical protein [Candidatus Woesearchaeota archaeon]